MNIFRKEYYIRRFSKQSIVNGYSQNSYQDFKLKMGVQSFEFYGRRSSTVEANLEGKRVVRRIKAYSKEPLIAVDQEKMIKGDWLYYEGKWYECKYSFPWQHLFLKHWRLEFVCVPETEPLANIAPPSI